MGKWKDNQKTKSILLLMGLLLFSGIVIYWDFLFGNYYLTFNDVGSDTWQQYMMQYHTIVNHIRNGNFSWWDFNNGFGVNMFQLNLFDPSLMLLYAIGVAFGPDKMAGALVYVQILRILAAGLVGYLFLSEFSLSEKAKVFAAYIYGLNGFLLVWGQHYQFGMITVYLPLILRMLEQSWKKRRAKAGLPIVVFLVVIDSTYFSYMCCLTAGIYLVFRALLEEELYGAERRELFFRLCKSMLLGVGMGLLVLLPSAYVIFNVTSRMESSASLGERLMKGFEPLDREYYKTLLYRFFSANLQNKNGDYAGSIVSNYYEDPSVFASIFFVIFGAQYFFVLWRMKISTYRKVILYGVTGLVGFALAFPLVGIVYNGFSIHFSRYTFALMPFFVLLIAWMTDYFLEGGKISIVGLLSALVMMLHVYRMGYSVTNHSDQKSLIAAMAVVGILSVAAVGTLGFWKNEKAKRPIGLILLLLAMCDMCLEGRGTVTDRVAVEKNDTTYLADLYSQDVQEALQYLSETDEEFYRVEKYYPEETACMSALAQDYHGVSTYNSMQNGEIQRFVDYCAPRLRFADQNHYRFSQVAKDGTLSQFFGVRYLLSKNVAPKSYKFVKAFRTVNLYESRKEANLGTFYGIDQVVTEKEFRKMVKQVRGQKKIDKILMETLGLDVSEEVLERRREAAAEAEESGTAAVTIKENGDDAHLTGTVKAPEDGYVLFTIPYEGGWNIQVDGEKKKILKADIGFMAVPVAAGSHKITLTYEPPLLEEGIVLAGICWILYIYYFVMRRRKGVKVS